MGVPPGLLFDSGGFGITSAASQRRDELLSWAAAWSSSFVRRGFVLRHCSL